MINLQSSASLFLPSMPAGSDHMIPEVLKEMIFDTQFRFFNTKLTCRLFVSSCVTFERLDFFKENLPLNFKVCWHQVLNILSLSFECLCALQYFSLLIWIVYYFS